MFPSLYSGYGRCSYGTLSLTAQSPSQIFAEPLTIAEVKSYLLLPLRSPVDPQEDDTILTFISTAREIAEIEQGRDLVRKQWDLSSDYFWSYTIELRDPLISVDLFQRTDNNGVVTALVQNTDYRVDTSKRPGIVTPVYNATWPSFTAAPSSAVLIRFTSGYSSTDAFWKESGRRLKLGMKMLISEWYNNRLPIDKDSEYAKSLFRYGALERPR